VAERRGTVDARGEQQGGDANHRRLQCNRPRVQSAVPEVLAVRCVRPSRLLLAAAGACLAGPALAGTITGKVSMVEKGGKTATDLSEVVVFVDGVKARVRPATEKIVMKGKAFLPHVAAVGVGSTVEFPNDDPIFHNAFSVSGENRFDLDLYKRPKSGAQTFQHPGVVKVYCNIHPQMSATIVVRDNPWFTKAAADGAFRIEGVPAGKHALKAWHERGGEVTVEVAVPADGEVSAPLALDASAFRRTQHKNKFGKDYGPGEKY
jgi:plastocyanin